MDLGALRSDEDSVRQKLVVVRARLKIAVDAIAEAASAEKESAHPGDAKPGAYRAVADERLGARRDRIAAGDSARVEREQLRREESELLGELERNRLAMEAAGVTRIVLPQLADLPDAGQCSMRWNDLDGDGDVRTCSRCKKIVRNIALLDSVDGETFPVDPSAPLFRRPDGTIVFGECSAVGKPRDLTAPLFGLAVTVCALASVAYLGLGLRLHARAPAHDTPPSVPYPSASSEDTAPHIDPLPAPETVQLSRPATLVIHDQFSSPGARLSVDIALVNEKNDKFSTRLECGDNGIVLGEISAARVDAFIAALDKRKISYALPMVTCTGSEDYDPVRVRITTSEAKLSLLRHCSSQWLARDVPLDDEPSETGPDGSRSITHAEINQRYAELIREVDLKQCVSLRAMTKPDLGDHSTHDPVLGSGPALVGH